MANPFHQVKLSPVFVVQGQKCRFEKEHINIEIQKYFNQPQILEENDVVIYFKNYEEIFPTQAKLELKY